MICKLFLRRSDVASEWFRANGMVACFVAQASLVEVIGLVTQETTVLEDMAWNNTSCGLLGLSDAVMLSVHTSWQSSLRLGLSLFGVHDNLNVIASCQTCPGTRAHASIPCHIDGRVDEPVLNCAGMKMVETIRSHLSHVSMYTW